MKNKIIIVFVIIILAYFLINGISENRVLKRQIKDIEKEKVVLLQGINTRENSIKIHEKTIYKLQKERDSLQKLISNVKINNNNAKIKYLNSNVNERIAIFTDLATNTDKR